MTTIQPDKLPQHVAIVMDGNGRWAKSRNLPRLAGHKAGVESVRTSVKFCVEHHIPVLTIFAFSSENWKRPKLEITGLKQLFFLYLRKEIKQLHQQQVRLRFIGDLSQFGKKLQQEARAAQELTADNTALEFNIALNYGGQWDICQAMQQIARQVQAQAVLPEQIDSTMIEHYLTTSGSPAVDLYIRTSGEQRISNFLLWQIAYAELYFCDCYWPDFNAEKFMQAVLWFQQRDRRFGSLAASRSS